jgi:hypothetical protein
VIVIGPLIGKGFCGVCPCRAQAKHKTIVTLSIRTMDDIGFMSPRLSKRGHPRRGKLSSQLRPGSFTGNAPKKSDARICLGRRSHAMIPPWLPSPRLFRAVPLAKPCAPIFGGRSRCWFFWALARSLFIRLGRHFREATIFLATTSRHFTRRKSLVIHPIAGLGQNRVGGRPGFYSHPRS